MRGLQERGTVAPLKHRAPGGLLLAVGIAIVVVVVDQVTTSVAESDLRHPAHLLGPFGLAVRYNSGSAFSLFTGDAPVLVVVSVVLVVALAVAAWRTRSRVAVVGIGLVLGGALGNLADRLFRGHHGNVVDFITLSHWPTFNVADACITVGLVLLVIHYWRRPGPGHQDVGSAEAGPGRGRTSGPDSADL
ncbi:MAG: signal peptidase II [Acidimicrobiales bacterium]